MSNDAFVKAERLWNLYQYELQAARKARQQAAESDEKARQLAAELKTLSRQFA